VSGSRLAPAGIVVSVQGVKGLVRVKTFTETSGAIGDYGDLMDATGDRTFAVKVIEARETVAILKIVGVDGRAAAEQLKGLTLYLNRDALPEPEPDEFFHSDLVGLSVETDADGRIGEVAALYDYGAGELIEITMDDGSAPLVLPFTEAVVPDILVSEGRIRVDPPGGLWPREESKTAALKRARSEK
jgi:16S rRNA processing protein RimM